MTETGAKTAIVREIAAAAAADAAPDLQFELLPPTRTTMTPGEQARVEAAVKRDRAGRPPGAQNKATREMLDFVRSVCGDPLERRFRWAMHTPESLSIELGCTKLEAFDRLERMWADLARFFYAQRASVDDAGNAVVPRLTMVIGGQTAAVVETGGEELPPWIRHLRTIDGTATETQQNQSLPASPDAVSHGHVSHSDGK